MAFFNQKQVFFIISIFKSIKQRLYYFFLNSYLKFVSVEFKISNLLIGISRNKFLLAFIIIGITCLIIFKTYNLIQKVLKLKKFFFYLKKHQKFETKLSTLLTLQSNYQLISSQLIDISVDLSHLLFLLRFLSSFFYM